MGKNAVSRSTKKSGKIFFTLNDELLQGQRVQPGAGVREEHGGQGRHVQYQVAACLMLHRDATNFSEVNSCV
jgi:hypothetical protein